MRNISTTRLRQRAPKVPRRVNAAHFETNTPFVCSILGSQRAAEIRTVLTRMEELEEEKRNATLEKERQSLQILERIKLQSEHDNMTKAELARLRHLEKLDMVMLDPRGYSRP